MAVNVVVRRLFCLLTLALVCLTLANADRPKYATKKSLNSRYSILPLGDDDSDDDNSLYYNSADLTSDDPKDAVDQNQLEPLLAEIIANADNLTELDKCQRYRSQISDICLAKFVQRTRVRPEEVRQASGTESQTPVDGGKPARPSFNLASPQQICCEFRMTYMRCLLANVNQVCPLTEFNTLYDQVQGLSEICSRFFAKSSKKCRKRFRKRPVKVASAEQAVTDIDVNVTGSSLAGSSSSK